MKRKLTKLVKDATHNAHNMINHYKRLNQSYSIFPPDVVEMVSAEINNTLCCATGGSGWDNKDFAEVKGCSFIQSKKCNDCGSKVPFFNTKCNECHSTNLKAPPEDARWGINAKTHFEFFKKLKEYRLFLIEPETLEPSCRTFRIRHWTLDKKSKHFNLYAKKQLTSGSASINFQPLKIDFYLSKPVLKFDMILDVSKDGVKLKYKFFDLDNTTPEVIPTKYKGVKSLNQIEGKAMNKKRGKLVRL